MGRSHSRPKRCATARTGGDGLRLVQVIQFDLVTASIASFYRILRISYSPTRVDSCLGCGLGWYSLHS